MKVYQSAFVQNLVIEKGLTNYNVNVILIKADSSILITNPENYNETDFYIYQKLVKKLIYFLYSTRPDIAFIKGQFNRYNANPRKKHL